ncbi:MAG TPA: SAM-dependent methyltransferase [Verrucomicrobiae bacterium]|nr:SAM-dependent methyltransferase [Verrucomicrobiae bacterium]
MKTKQKIEFGDFQTPLPLAREVCAKLNELGVAPDVVVEPTSGAGNFLRAAAEAFPNATLEGLEINEEHLRTASSELKEFLNAGRIRLHLQDFFVFDWDTYLSNLQGQLLMLGNPPWVTNSTVSGFKGSNLPEKQNFLGLRGFAARTGKSNFDISEWMLIRLLQALRGRPATLAMLCKSMTACKALRYAWQNDGRVASASIYQISAKEHFDASVDACLFVAQLGHVGPPEAAVYPNLRADTPERRVGLCGKDLVSDLATYNRLRNLEGLSLYQWRSGLKHDCAAVMELEPRGDGRYCNKQGQEIALEADYVYPLLKSTDLSKGRCVSSRWVLVTQRHTGEDTAPIASRAPLTWSYLNSHQDAFKARKSSIYSGRSPFAVFGIGEYAFASWKVAVSALHHEPRFVVVCPHQGKPVMFDDTCYYLGFAGREEADVVAEILNSPPCRQFLHALIFPGTKRPLTVELLQRLNVKVIAQEGGFAAKWNDVRKKNHTAPLAAPQLQFIMERPSS